MPPKPETWGTQMGTCALNGSSTKVCAFPVANYEGSRELLIMSAGAPFR